METKNSSTRINQLIAEIGEQINQILLISDNEDIDTIVPSEKKNDFIIKQAEIILDYVNREESDTRDQTIALLKADLEKAEKYKTKYRDDYLDKVCELSRTEKALKALAAYVGL